MERLILAVNSGTSSVKFALFDESLTRKLFGSVTRIGLPNSLFQVEGAQSFSSTTTVLDHTSAADLIGSWLVEHTNGSEIATVGHRIVSAQHHREPELLSDKLLLDLRNTWSLDPEHTDGEIALLNVFRKRFSASVHVVCFDTAFFSDLPRVAQMTSLPRHFENNGIRRHGFHGLSYSYLMQEISQIASDLAYGRIILAHLGSGSSLCAVQNGKPVDMTMGTTPNSGVMMGTRSGDLDAGLVAHLLKANGGMNPEIFSHLVSFESGLLGVSEISADMYDLLQQENDVRASETIALFCHQIKKQIGALATVLGGVDMLVFSGGMGDKAPKIRARVCENLAFLGITLDEAKNNGNESIISKEGGMPVRVIPTNEELMIATYARSMGNH
ncbi:MAG TPA: acetate/propionate family kinase [Candidatus Paceibacterota bacterium]|nr:acetate/propionate family kinase [Candidatus Paceibacterota bacterium]